MSFPSPPPLLDDQFWTQVNRDREGTPPLSHIKSLLFSALGQEVNNNVLILGEKNWSRKLISSGKFITIAKIKKRERSTELERSRCFRGLLPRLFFSSEFKQRRPMYWEGRVPLLWREKPPHRLQKQKSQPFLQHGKFWPLPNFFHCCKVLSSPQCLLPCTKLARSGDVYKSPSQFRSFLKHSFCRPGSSRLHPDWTTSFSYPAGFYSVLTDRVSG